MPYADAEQQKAAKRESARRRRAARGTVVEPISPTVTTADLMAAGRILGHMRGDGETDDAYRNRLRAVWRILLRVVTEEGDAG